MRKIILLALSIMIVLTGCTKTSDNANDDLYVAKIEELDKYIIEVLNNISGYNFNKTKVITKFEEAEIESNDENNEDTNNEIKNVQYTEVVYKNILEEEDLDWNKALDNILSIKEIMEDIEIDLKKYNVKNEKIIEINNIIDDLFMNIRSKEQINCINNLYELYKLDKEIISNNINKDNLKADRIIYDEIMMCYMDVMNNNEEQYNLDFKELKEKIKEYNNMDNNIYLNDKLNTILFNIEGLDLRDKKDILRIEFSKLIEIMMRMIEVREKIDN